MFHLLSLNNQPFRSSSVLYFKGRHGSQASGSKTHYTLPTADCFKKAEEGASETTQTDVEPFLPNTVYTNTGVMDAFWKSGYIYDAIFEKSVEELYTAAQNNDTRIVRAFLKAYPGDKVTRELDPLPTALLYAAKNGQAPTVKLILEKNNHLIKYQTDDYLWAFRQGFSAAASNGFKSVVREMLPIMSQLHQQGFSDLYYTFHLQNGFLAAARNGDLKILDMIKPELKKYDTGRYRFALCRALDEAASHGQPEMLQQLLPAFRPLRDSHPNEYAQALWSSTASAADRENPAVTNLLIHDFVALVRAQPENSAYAGTLFNAVCHAAETNNLALLKVVLPMCKQIKKYHSEELEEKLSSAYWKAKQNGYLEIAAKLKPYNVYYYGPPMPPFED